MSLRQRASRGARTALASKGSDYQENEMSEVPVVDSSTQLSISPSAPAVCTEPASTSGRRLGTRTRRQQADADPNSTSNSITPTPIVASAPAPVAAPAPEASGSIVRVKRRSRNKRTFEAMESASADPVPADAATSLESARAPSEEVLEHSSGSNAAHAASASSSQQTTDAIPALRAKSTPRFTAYLANSMFRSAESSSLGSGQQSAFQQRSAPAFAPGRLTGDAPVPDSPLATPQHSRSPSPAPSATASRVTSPARPGIALPQSLSAARPSQLASAASSSSADSDSNSTSLFSLHVSSSSSSSAAAVDGISRNSSSNGLAAAAAADMEVEATDPTLLDDPSLQLHDPHPTNASRFPLKSHLLQKIEQEMEALRSGAHVVYLQKLALLEEEMRARVADAERERDVRIASIQALCDADCKQAEFQLQMEKNEAFEQLMDELRKKKKHVDVYGAMPLQSDSNMNTRGKRVKQAALEERLARARRNLPTVKSVKTQLALAEVKSDLAAIRAQLPSAALVSGATRPAFQGRAKASSQDIRVERGQLHYFEKLVRRGDAVVVQDDKNQIDTLLVASISNTELVCQRDDGSDQRLWISHLRGGKFAILQVNQFGAELS